MNKLFQRAPKILYGIQGTGNGHMARALEILPIVKEYGDVDIVVSGDQSHITLPFEVKYRSRGLTFVYNKKGGISLWKTFFKSNLFRIIKEIMEFPIDQYDIVITDFEFITAWACKLKGKRCFGMGHQPSFLSTQSPRPKKKDLIGEWILKHYCPVTDPIGFHFSEFDSFIHKPVIRNEIRQLNPDNKGYYTVYLPAFSDEFLYHYLSQLKNIRWEVFSKQTQENYRKGNLTFNPINNQQFLESFANCSGILTSAGFETPSEAIYLGKKLFIVPIKNQYEQYCNAAALEALGVNVRYDLDKNTLQYLLDWVNNKKALHISYPDETRNIIHEKIFLKILEENQRKDINRVNVIY